MGIKKTCVYFAAFLISLLTIPMYGLYYWIGSIIWKFLEPIIYPGSTALTIELLYLLTFWFPAIPCGVAAALIAPYQPKPKKRNITSLSSELEEKLLPQTPEESISKNNTKIKTNMSKSKKKQKGKKDEVDLDHVMQHIAHLPGPELIDAPKANKKRKFVDVRNKEELYEAKECWACNVFLLKNQNHQSTDTFTTELQKAKIDIKRIIDDSWKNSDKPQLIRMLKEFAKLRLKPLYAKYKNNPNFEWTAEEIEAHIFDHDINPKTETMNQRYEYKQRIKTCQKNMTYVDSQGNDKIDKTYADLEIRYNKEILALLTKDFSKSITNSKSLKKT
jgi:hypothetical protein